MDICVFHDLLLEKQMIVGCATLQISMHTDVSFNWRCLQQVHIMINIVVGEL